MIYDKKSEINDLHTVFLLIIIIFYKKNNFYAKGSKQKLFLSKVVY